MDQAADNARTTTIFRWKMRQNSAIGIPANLTIFFGNNVQADTITERWQWPAFECQLYAAMPGAIPTVTVELEGDSTDETRAAFRALSTAVLDRTTLERLYGDDKPDVSCGLVQYRTLPYRRRPQSSRISLRELVEYPAEHPVGDRLVSLSPLQRFDLILCETVEKGKSFLLSLVEKQSVVQTTSVAEAV